MKFAILQPKYSQNRVRVPYMGIRLLTITQSFLVQFGVGPGLWPADLEGHKHSDPLLQLARSLLCRPWDITPQVTNRRSTVIRHFHSTTHSPARCTLCYLDWSKYALTFTPHFYNPHFRFCDPHSTTPSPTFYHPLTPQS